VIDLPAHRRGGRIVVLGAGGFLGSHLVPALAARAAAPIDAVDLTLAKLPPTGAGVTRIEGSIADRALVERLLDRAAVVVSLTALCNPSLYNTRPLDVIAANFTDLLPIVERAAAAGIRLVHFSTSEVYGRAAVGPDGRAAPDLLMNEDDTPLLLGPVRAERWSYATAKLLLERVIWAHGAHGGLPFTIVRPFNVLGPRMDYVPGVDGEGVPRVLASFMAALLRGAPLPLVEGGHQRRSFVAVDELVEAVVRIVERPEATRGQILNLGNPASDVTIAALAQALAAEYARQVPGAAPARFLEVSARAFYGEGYDDVAARLPDIAKARRLLGWEPRATLAEMLPTVVRDYVARYAGRVSAAGAPR
jgi:UDP-apiose/xylose synthase